MRTVVDHRGGQPQLPRPRNQDGQARFESWWRKTVLRIYSHDGRAVLADLGIGIRCDLASLHRAKAPLDSVDAMRLAAVPLARGDYPSHRRGLPAAKPGLAEYRLNAVSQFRDAQPAGFMHADIPIQLRHPDF